jgi:hypothetical protein
MTERGHYRFAAQEGARGEFWIVAEPAGDTIGSLDDRTLVLICGRKRRWSKRTMWPIF